MSRVCFLLSSRSCLHFQFFPPERESIFLTQRLQVHGPGQSPYTKRSSHGVAKSCLINVTLSQFLAFKLHARSKNNNNRAEYLLASLLIIATYDKQKIELYDCNITQVVVKLIGVLWNELTRTQRISGELSAGRGLSSGSWKLTKCNQYSSRVPFYGANWMPIQFEPNGSFDYSHNRGINE